MNDVLDGAQNDCPTWKSVKRVPFAARASRVGVTVRVPVSEN